MKEITINCTGSRYMKYEELQQFQGNLKAMSDNQKQLLKKSIIEKGWIAPIFVWNNKEILDGHGRLKVLKELLQEGYTIGDIPIVDVKAKTKKEAAKILLAINSKYQTITEDGLNEFIASMEIDYNELSDYILPDIDIDVAINDLSDVLDKELKKEATAVAPIIINLTLQQSKKWRQIKKQIGIKDDTDAFLHLLAQANYG